MKKSILSLAASLVCVGAMSLPAVAQASGTLSFNASATTDYRYRGISQSRVAPAVQGGVDYGLSNGVYLGAWASSIRWINDLDPASDAPVEIDLYGGWKGEVAKGLTLDVGLLSYQYPGNEFPTKAETLEIYGALSFGPATVKYSHSTTPLFGVPDSEGSGYFDVSAAFDVGGGLMLSPHIGYQKVANADALSYTDYSLSVSKDFDGWVPALTLVGTNADEALYTVKDKFLGKTGLVLSIKKNF
jgi:uncharacterized protein (TIGR02001 family)